PLGVEAESALGAALGAEAEAAMGAEAEAAAKDEASWVAIFGWARAPTTMPNSAKVVSFSVPSASSSRMFICRSLLGVAVAAAVAANGTATHGQGHADAAGYLSHSSS
ncbi:MAG: hypothetical protein VX622_07995, partial [Pseudomonadota bacterium]|nr:hypothetical protein [Pseudomonadota bacterium]